MPHIDPTQLTDSELVAAANEYIIRANRKMRVLSPDGNVHIHLQALDSSWDPGKFDITHSIDFRQKSEEDVRLKGGNLFELADKHAMLLGIKVTPAVAVCPMLAAPTEPEQPGVEDAHWTEVPPASPPDEDDVPF